MNLKAGRHNSSESAINLPEVINSDLDWDHPLCILLDPDLQLAEYKYQTGLDLAVLMSQIFSI